jgi:recombinational DNA repair protein (RecF pathway)
MGVGLSFSSCVYCGSNQELLDFDASQGGIICKNHTKNNVALKLLKSLFLLGYSREKYVLETSPETNQEVLKMLGDLLI